MRKLLLLVIAMSATAADLPPNASSPLCTNVWFFRDWVSEYSMVDAFKASRAWVPHCMTCTPSVWDTGEAARIDVDEQGWVKSLPASGAGVRFTSVGTLMLDGFGAHYPAGQYVVLYDGEGTLAYGRDAVRNAALSAPGRDVIDVTPAGGGIWLAITATDPQGAGNYIRNIRVIMPGFEETYRDQPYHPDFLDKLRPYRAIRFMQWMEINGSRSTDWAKRIKPSDARWNVPASSGVPLEVMLDIANRLSADAWVNIPHQAGDDYMRDFAALAKEKLNAGRKLYIEYSNEVWNGSAGFDQSMWVQRKAIEKWPDPSISAFTKQINWHGMRTAQMCDIFKDVWGEERGRVVCVMGAQSGNPWTGAQALDCPMWTEGAPCYKHGIDALAGGPYFGGYIGNVQVQDQVAAWTKDDDGGLGKLFDELTKGGVLQGGPAGGALERANQEIQGGVDAARQRGVVFLAYEGGSHFASVGNNATVTELFTKAANDARFGKVYDQYLANWRTRGGQMFCHYLNVGQPMYLGVFGAFDYMDSPASPKQESLMRFIEANPCWWSGCAPGQP